MVLKIFKSLFGSKTSWSRKSDYVPIMNPFITSVFLWVDNVEVGQLIEWLTYYRKRDKKMANKIKDILKWFMPIADIEKLEELDKQMYDSDLFVVAMEYVKSKYPEEIKEIDLYLKEHGNKADPSYYVGKIIDLYQNVNIEYMMIKINDLLSIPGQRWDDFIEYLTVDRKNIAQLAYSKKLTQVERAKHCDKLIKLISAAKNKYNISKELFTIQRLLFEISWIIKNLDNSEIKYKLEEWTDTTEYIYLYWKWIDFQIQWNIQEDGKDIEFYKKNWYNLDIQVKAPLLTNVELANKILSELKILNEKKDKLEIFFE